MLPMLCRINLQDQVIFAIYLKNINCSPNTILKFHAFLEGMIREFSKKRQIDQDVDMRFPVGMQSLASGVKFQRKHLLACAIPDSSGLCNRKERASGLKCAMTKLDESGVKIKIKKTKG